MKILLQNISAPFYAEDGELIDKAIKMLKSVGIKARRAEARIYKKSIDARKKQDIKVVCSVGVDVDEELSPERLASVGAVKIENARVVPELGNEKLSARPLVVGMGPAGLFCALVLAENGYKPIVLERGGNIQERNIAVNLFRTNGILNTENNIQFGAGGAGTFSDGKLVTRINDKKCRYVLETFHKHGAPDSILTEAKPHIGTDNLGKIVSSVKENILRKGGEIYFNTRFEGYKSTKKGIEVKTNNGTFFGGALVLATGHSARDTYKLLAENGLEMQSKAFSVGVRVEQLQEEINHSVYGKYADILGNAEYNFSYRKGERAVYTFCMCPGGHVVEAASEEESVVVNGMSNYNRDGKNSNAALVVSVLPEDCGNSLFDGMNFQRYLERKAFAMGGKDYGAPIQTVGDYLNNKSGTVPKRIQPSYMDGKRNNLCDINELFPSYVNSFLKEGLVKFENKINGYAPHDAVMTAVETRTSSPLRIVRNDMLFSPTDSNIFPCGEGAGYAGGITSASVDGIRVALCIIGRYKPIE